jgi:hypothetical protein
MRLNKVIHITARNAFKLFFWSRIVVLRSELRSQGALPLIFKMIPSPRENHPIPSGMASCFDESQPHPRRRSLRPARPIPLEVSCNRCTTSPPVAR